MESFRGSYEFLKGADPNRPRDSSFGLALGTFLAQKKMELGFVVNIKVLGLCLSIQKRYNLPYLDIPSGIYAQITKDCSSWVS